MLYEGKSKVHITEKTTNNHELEDLRIGEVHRFNCPSCGDRLEVEVAPGWNSEQECSCDDIYWVGVG